MIILALTYTIFMVENVRLIKNTDGSYDLAIYMDKYDEEFSGEFPTVLQRLSSD